ncbi:hypothetical protein [Streptomyces sp. NPDC037389]|uniref:hypothetical protein n=1 Tax=Streptomyces sp. NPDC037389 TaxID=3155369 RepID=UPI0033CA1BC4
MTKADRPDLERAWRQVMTTPHSAGPGPGPVVPPEPTCPTCPRIDVVLLQAVRSRDTAAETRIARERAAHWSSEHRTVQW